MVEIMVFLSEVCLITLESSWIIINKTHSKTLFFRLDKCFGDRLLFIHVKFYFPYHRKDKNWENCDSFSCKIWPKCTHFYLFFCSLTTTWQFKRSFNFEIVDHRKSMMLSRSLCWYTFYFTLFENKLAQLHVVILYFTKSLGSILNSIILNFFLPHFFIPLVKVYLLAVMIC